MNNIKEILPDKINVVTEDGDVIPSEGSFDNDYELIEIEPPEPSLVDGVSIRLGKRALAIERIMNNFNRQSTFEGAKSEKGRASLSKTYGSKSIDVLRGMRQKANDAEQSIQEEIDRLLMPEQLTKAGFTQDEIYVARKKLENELKDEYGPGESDYQKRKKAVAKVKKTAG